MTLPCRLLPITLDTGRIYRICLSNGAVYIGKTSGTLQERLAEHLAKPTNEAMAAALNDQATIELILEFKYKTEKALRETEEFYIAQELTKGYQVLNVQHNRKPQKSNAAPPEIPTAEQNQETAVSKLAATDWVNEPDVYDPLLTPHLLNRSEYLTYRSQLRAIAIAPTAGNLDWPTEPTPQWS